MKTSAQTSAGRPARWAHWGALLVLEPVKLPGRKLTSLRQLAAEGLSRLEDGADEELTFHRKFHASVDGVFAALLERS